MDIDSERDGDQGNVGNQFPISALPNYSVLFSSVTIRYTAGRSIRQTDGFKYEYFSLSASNLSFLAYIMHTMNN